MRREFEEGGVFLVAIIQEGLIEPISDQIVTKSDKKYEVSKFNDNLSIYFGRSSLRF